VRALCRDDWQQARKCEVSGSHSSVPEHCHMRLVIGWASSYVSERFDDYTFYSWIAFALETRELELQIDLPVLLIQLLGIKSRTCTNGLYSIRIRRKITVSFAGWSLQNEHHPKPAAPNLQHTTNWEQDDLCGNSSTQSQAPDDGYINVRNMLST